ncbi:hypothetical protein [Candidatus Poriferisodalis sp.]|uniref:hypothetical protein n=1 Tax=Candidatus Poriferisodalis sp. TaxID=3101277 RepID=UPI003B022DAB
MPSRRSTLNELRNAITMHGRTRPASDERGEVFPVAILFGGVLLTILVGVHVVLHSIATTAVQAAADRGVAAAAAAPIGSPISSCPPLTDLASGGPATPTSERQCQGGFAAWAAMNASTGMVRLSQPPAVIVDEGTVSVVAFGTIRTPVLGSIDVVGFACGPLDFISDHTSAHPDASVC